MFGPRKDITIIIKLYGGLDRQAKIDTYDPDSGIELKTPDKTKLKNVPGMLGLSRRESVVFFVNGKKAGPNQKLNHNDVVFCMKPVSGG